MTDAGGVPALGEGGPGRNRVPVVRVYHREGCHLCDELLAALEVFRGRYTFRFETVDIDEDPALLTRFNVKVPVVEVDGDILCCHRLDVAALNDALSEAQAAGASRV